MKLVSYYRRIFADKEIERMMWLKIRIQTHETVKNIQMCVFTFKFDFLDGMPSQVESLIHDLNYLQLVLLSNALESLTILHAVSHPIIAL